MTDIIIPAYNAQKTIIRTLYSVINQQNVKDINVYIIDDCSKDNYDDVYNMFSKFVNLKIYRLEKNSGPGVARQYGLEHSNGDNIVFLDADDELADNYAIENLLTKIDESDVVFGMMYQESDKSTSFHEGCLHGKMYKRSYLEEKNIKFNGLRSHEDNAFNQLCLACTKKTRYVDKIIYKYNYTKNSITNTEDQVESLKLYIKSMTWLFEQIEKQEYVNTDYTCVIIYTTMLYCYYNFLLYENDAQFVYDKLPFLKKMYYKYIDYLSNEDFVDIFKNFDYPVVPNITFYEFLDKIK